MQRRQLMTRAAAGAGLVVGRASALGACALGLTAQVLAQPARGSLADTVAAVRASVVAMGFFRPTDNPRFTFRGSGFVVGDGRLVVTNAHTLPTETLDAAIGERLAVVSPGARRGATDMRPARLLAVNPRVDLAVLEITGEPLPTMRLAQGEAREGQAIAVMGYPLGGTLGINPVVHRGVVSALVDVTEPAISAARLSERAVQQLRAGPFTVYQLDATAYPGNSGGPLIDADSGEVLGIINMVLVKSSRESALSAPTGITYAIPTAHAVELLRSPEVRSRAPG